MTASITNVASDCSPRGFALVVALSLMSFVLMLLLALSTIIEVELRRAQTELDQFAARQNAEFGLRLAVAMLQAEAGVDTISTARAEVLASVVVDEDEMSIDGARLLWTGVFPSDLSLEHGVMQQSVRWLVSGGGDGLALLTGSGGDWVSMIRWRGVDSANGVVEAPRVVLPREVVSGGGSLGSYAFWVMDEGVKAKVNLGGFMIPEDNPDDMNIPFYAAGRFAQENISGHSGLAALFKSDSDLDSGLLGRMISVSDLHYLDLIDAIADGVDQRKDLTTYSLGVLADGRLGGLRRDLTHHLDPSQAFSRADFFVQQDNDNYAAAGRPTGGNSWRDFRMTALGPPWGLLQDFANLHMQLTDGGSAISPRVDPENEPAQQINVQSGFGETVTIAPVLIYQGLSYGLELDEVGREDLRLAEASRSDLASLLHAEGGITSAVLDASISSHPIQRVFFQVNLTVEPLVALWNPYDVRLEEQTYLIEVKPSNHRWGAQPGLFLENSSVRDWILFNSREYRDPETGEPVTTLFQDPGDQRWYVFPDDRGTGFSDWESLFNSTEMQLLPSPDALTTWRFHLTEMAPQIKDHFDTVLMVESGGGAPSSYNSFDLARGGSRGFTIAFAIPNVSLEPGEIRWYSLSDNIDGTDPAERVLTEGFFDGHLKVPFDDKVGWRSSGNNPPYMNAARIMGDGSLRRPWIDSNGQERGWGDVGLIVLDQVSPGGPAGMGNTPVSLGLSHRRGQYSAALYMLRPSYIAEGNTLADAMVEPFGLDGNDPFAKWQRTRYVNVSSGSDSNLSRSPIELPPDELHGWSDYLISTGVYILGPDRLERSPRSDHNVGTKIMNIGNIAGTYQGRSEPRDRTIIDNEVSFEPRTYMFNFETAPLFAFDEFALWHEPAIVRADDSIEYRAVLFHVPRDELFSIGQFQHLNMGRSNLDATYLVGNSFASPWIPADETVIQIRNSASGPNDLPFPDRSWLYNNELADSAFFSTWRPAERTHPRNQRYVRIDNDPVDGDEIGADNAAARLMIDGPFNVNSTSIEAWKAVLGGMNLLDITFQDVASDNPGTTTIEELSNPFLRNPRPPGGTARQPDGGDFPMGDTAYWRGFRQLSPLQVEELAEAIVEEIKTRGPFRTVSEFFNRRPGESSSPQALVGAIQAAIDRQSATSSEPINPEVFDGNVVPTSGGFVNDGSYAYAEAALGPRHTGAPGFLMQADVLSPLAPFLTARSDTFIVRAFGESGRGRNPARAWCEAVVQRVPQYVDDGDPAELAPNDLSATNQKFGRRYVILSMRWLNEDEI